MYIKSRKMPKSERRVLYIRYFTSKGKEVVKSTGLDDTKQNREYVKNTVIPALKKKLEILELDNKLAKQTFNYFALEYLKEKDSLKTYWEIHARVVKLIDYFGKDTQVGMISVAEIRGFINGFKSSAKTLRHYISDLRQILQIALYDEAIDINPVERVKLPKHKKGEISPYSDKDIDLVMNEAKGNILGYFGIAFNTGARSGEIIGLKIKDIDFENRYINIKRSISKGVISTPKTASSIRSVPFAGDIEKYLKMQIEEAIDKGSNFLFSKENGEPLYGVDALNLKRFLRRLKVNNRIYDTRHTFIIKMLNTGKIKVMDLARIVGHTNPQMILTTYAKYVKSEQIKIEFDINITQKKQ